MSDSSLLITRAELQQLAEHGYLWHEYYGRFIFPQDRERFTLLESVSPDGVSIQEVMKRLRYRAKDDPTFTPGTEPEPPIDHEAEQEPEATGFTPNLVARLEALEAKPAPAPAPAEPVQVHVSVEVPSEAIKIETRMPDFVEIDEVQRDEQGFISRITRRFRAADTNIPEKPKPSPANPTPSLRDRIRKSLNL